MSLFSKLTKNHADKGSAYPWSQRKLGGASSLLPRHGHAATALPLEETILIFGGIHSKSKKDLFSIDTSNMSATSVSTTGDVPSPRLFPVMVPMSVNNLILLYGGEPGVPGEKWDPHFYVLNTSTRQWSRIQMSNDSLPVERSGHSVAAAGSCLYIWGGQRAGRYLDDMFMFNTNTFPANPRWEYVASNNRGPAGRSGHVSAIFENKLYIFGGTDGDHLYNDIWCYDLHSRYWMQVPAIGFIPIPREGCASALVDDVLYVFGGRGPDGQDLGDLCAFKFRGQRWFRFQNMGPGPSARHELTFTAVGEKIVSIGGEASRGRLDEHTVYILDTAKIRYPPEQPPAQDPMQPPQQREASPAATIESDTLRYPSPTPSPQNNAQMGQIQRESPVPRTDSPPVIRDNNSTPPQSTTRHRPLHPDTVQNSNAGATPPSRPPRHISMIPEAALKRPRATSPLPSLNEDVPARRQVQPDANGAVDPNPTNRTLSPTHPEFDNSHPAGNHLPPSSPQAQSPSPQRPPRPPREGSSTSIRQTVAISMYQTSRPDLQQHLQVDTTKRSFSPQSQPSPADTLTSDVDPAELEALVREIRAKEAIISNMKKMEPWWRNEVSIARRMRVARNDDEQQHGADADETLLMEMSDNANFDLFEKLVSFKSEVRRVKAGIQSNAAQEAMEEKIRQSDRMRTASLQEAAYFKSKLLALATSTSEPVHPSSEQALELEQKLAAVLEDNENRKRQLQQLNKSAQHDHAAREAAEERAREAQERAQEAQQAHERALQDLEHFYERATQAESQVKENAVKMADLQLQLADALSAGTPSKELLDARQKIMQLEDANQHVRSETRDLQEQLSSYAQDVEHLYNALKEREEALSNITKQIQNASHQLCSMKEVMSEKGLTPTTPTPSTTTTSAY